MQLLRVKEVAALLGSRPSTIYEWVALGLIPHVRLNGCLRFDAADIEAWVEELRTGERRPGAASRLLGRVVEAVAGKTAEAAVKAALDK